MSEAEVTEYYKGLVHSIVNEFVVISKLRWNSHIVSYEDHISGKKCIKKKYSNLELICAKLWNFVWMSTRKWATEGAYYY